MVVLAVMALGLVSLRSLAVDLLPNINVPVAVVATSYQGAGPQEIENLVTNPLEDSLVSIHGVDTMQSQSQANSSLILLLFKSDVNLDNALLEVREKVDQAKGFLPDDAGDPSVLRFDPNQQPIIYMSVTGEGHSLQELQEVSGAMIVPLIERQDGVGSASVSGGQTREIRVEFDRARLVQYGLSPSSIAQALGAENRSMPVGSVTKGLESLQLRVSGEFDSLSDIGNTLITLPSGQQIKVNDVAVIQDTFKEQSNLALVNGEPSLMLSVQKQSDANTVEVADEVYKAIDELNETLPGGIQLTMMFDSSTMIRDSIDSVVENLLYGGIFSIIVLWLFLRSIRTTLIISIAIPIAVISTFSLMYFTGQTVNIISMGGLALGVGMMVDSSIVILEGIVSERQKGASRMEASIKAATELGPSVIASAITAMIVFVPIVFVDGIAADLFIPMALTVAFSNVAALVVAITIVPMLSARMITDRAINKKKSWFQRGLEVLIAFYKKLLAWALGHRKTVVAVTILATIGSLALAPFIRMEFIPASGSGQLNIYMTAPSGYKLDEMKALTEEVTALLEPYRGDIEYTSVTIGGDGGPFGGATNTSSVMVQLLPEDQLQHSSTDIVLALGEAVQNIAGAEITIEESTVSLGGGSPIQIQVNGEDTRVLHEIGEQIVWVLSDIPGVLNPESSSSDGNSELNIIVDRSTAASYGLTYQEIMNEVSLSLNGQVATRYREAGNEYEVRVIMPEQNRSSIADLNALVVTTRSGQLVPLAAVAEFKQEQGPASIIRENQKQLITVSSGIIDRDLGSVSADVEAAMASMSLPDGYTYSIGGQTEDMEEAFIQLGLALAFAIFLVYAVMAIEFESFVYPFIIMFTMPTTTVGVMIGLFVTGSSLSIPSIMGLVMLAGIVVNNGIILVDYINIVRSKGMDRREAILEGAPTRVRPIMMTYLATVLGMLPLALGWGEGAETNQPMAIAIIFGLTFSSLFTMLFIPVMYTYMDGLANRTKRLFTRKGGPKKDVPAAETNVSAT